MNTAILPKFNWEKSSDKNSGHTSDEWGLKKNTSLPKIYVAYTVSW